MRQVTTKGLITAAAATGMLALSGGTAFADSADHTGSSNGSVLSGNNVQVPVNVPVNVCGNSVNVLGSGGSASGNECENESGEGSRAGGRTGGSDGGVGSGNNVQAPVNVPVNVCGLSVNVLSDGGTPASAECENETGDEAEPAGPGAGEQPQREKSAPSEPVQASAVRAEAPAAPAAPDAPATGELAHTGSGDVFGVGAPLSAGLLVGGYVLYRRAGRPAEG